MATYQVEHTYEGLLYSGSDKAKGFHTYHKWVGITKRQIDGPRYNGEDQTIAMYNLYESFEPIAYCEIESKA